MLSLGVAIPPAPAADVWRWVDKQGNVHYSDVPVAGAVRVSAHNPRPPAATSDATSGAGAAGANTTGSSAPTPFAQRAAEQLQNEAAMRAVQQDVAKRRAELCKQLSADYEKAITAQRLYNETPDGKREYLSDAELAATRLRLRQQRDAACGPAPR
ncbi:MAG: DUF4124 domain-containing protein [Gammaproteobacteria bacterium]|nr:DUF4124 domain-containing protein [Gammaproteobacteria bacterium]